MRKYKTRLIILFVLGLLICSFISLFRNQKQYLVIAAGKPNGDSFIFAKKLEHVVNNSNSNIELSVLKRTDGTQENLELLKKGRVQLAMAQADIPAPSEAQLVSLLFPDMYQLIVKKDSGIDSILDLKGKRVVLPPSGGGQIQSFDFLMEHYGLLNRKLIKYYVESDFKYSTNKYKFYSVESSNPDKAFCAGQADVVFHVRRAGNYSIRNEIFKNKHCNAKLIPIEQAKAMKIEHPDLDEAIIPKGAYQGNPPIPDKDLPTISVNRLFLAHKSVDKEVIHKITKILYEHRQELVYGCKDDNIFDETENLTCEHKENQIPAAALIRKPDNLSGAGGTGRPIHPGAKAYYQKEDPTWFERYSGVMEVLVAIAFPFVSWLALLFRENAAKKNKADDYILEVTALMDAEESIKAATSSIAAYKSNQIDVLEELRFNIINKTAKILLCTQKAQNARNKGKISRESLKSFRKTLQITVGVIEQIPESEKIFNAIVQKARKNMEKEHNKRLRNQLLSLIIIWDQSLGISETLNIKIPYISQIQNQMEKSLNNILDRAKGKTQQRLKNLEPSELLKLESKNIRQDLEAIFKRSVNALVEERISQDSFQSFRVVWQIAVGEVTQDE